MGTAQLGPKTGLGLGDMDLTKISGQIRNHAGRRSPGVEEKTTRVISERLRTMAQRGSIVGFWCLEKGRIFGHFSDYAKMLDYEATWLSSQFMPKRWQNHGQRPAEDGAFAHNAPANGTRVSRICMS